MFNATNQAFFMGFFFLLAGYYTPASYDRKGPQYFLTDRLLRLGVPLLVYFFVLSPLTIALARTSKGFPFWSGWWDMMRLGKFEPGPLWFAETLLLFAGGYMLYRKIRLSAPPVTALPGVSALALTALILGVSSFFVRLTIPVGKDVAWLQLGYFPCYIFLFAAGCAAGRSRLLERVLFRQAAPWMAISFVVLLTLPAVIFLKLGSGSFEGGWNSRAFYYALWDPFVGWGIILGLLWLAQNHWSAPTKLTAWLGRNAYGAYIVHPPIVVGLSLAITAWPVPPLGKFALVGATACLASFLAAALLRAIPGSQRIL
jgi:glucans biosynthesis protein C